MGYNCIGTFGLHPQDWAFLSMYIKTWKEYKEVGAGLFLGVFRDSK